MPEYTKHDEGTFSSLKKQQKEAVGLLSIGTFLEYFDLMLYVHMAVLLNELFFPKADPHTQAIYSAFAFCSTYLLRPFGALIFGWIGDNIGRKSTVIITTLCMSFSCFIMAVIPTYTEVGFIATILVTICRILQGLSSMGELIGAQLYLTEITKPPVRYPIVALTSVFSILGGTFALAIASLITMYNINWRTAFWFGSLVAIIGFIARTTLKETPDFANAKKRVGYMLNTKDNLNNNLIWSGVLEKGSDKRNIMALFLMDCAWPICFYFTYIYCGNLLKQEFGFSVTQVIHQNFIVSIIQLLGLLTLTVLSYKNSPLKIIKIKLVLFTTILVLTPYLITKIHSHYMIFFVQCCIILFACDYVPAVPITYKHISVFRRFTYSSFSYASSRVIMYIITSFGLVYLIEIFDYTGLLILTIPIVIGYYWGIKHFDRLEQEDKK